MSQLRFPELDKNEKSVHKSMFLKQFLKNPKAVGAIAPSSRYLTEAMLSDLKLDTVRRYLEYGPGTGSFTHEVFHRCQGIQHSALLEINETFQNLLRGQYPQSLIADRVKALPKHWQQSCDLIVSGIPFTNLPLAISMQTIEETVGLLRAGGHFRSFLYVHTFYLPKNRQLREWIESRFAKVSYQLVTLNVPPAIVIAAEKGRF